MPVVTFNCLALRPTGSGVQTYIRSLLEHVQQAAGELELRAVVQSDAVGELPPGVEPLIRRRSKRVRRALEGLRSPGPTDLVHGLDVDLPLRSRALSVATVHDLSVFDVPWTVDRLRGMGERALIAGTARRADALIAVSEFTADRLKQLLGRAATVIHEAAGPEMRPASELRIEACRHRYGLPDRFVLYVGDLGPRKGLDCLAHACRDAGVPLVVAGGHLEQRARVRGIRLGYVPDADLPALYSAATLFAFPSLYEGFGLPPLEAMACGTPVLASHIPPLKEVLGDAARLIPAQRPDAWSAVIREVFADSDAAAALSVAGRARAAEFNWERTATSTLAIYRDLGLRPVPWTHSGNVAQDLEDLPSGSISNVPERPASAGGDG